MAFTFRYRYVDFGTVFIGDLRSRDARNESEAPATLFANELVTDVGGTCWGSNEPLPILDHHFSAEGQFPSASAAVLHKARLIREKFAGQEHQVVWLVTHKDADFDAFCSMYLARWIIEAPEALDWRASGLHPDGWFDLADHAKIDWFNPDLSQASTAKRWPLLLAAYASALDDRHYILCPRERALNSVLYAALKRGRDYRTASSGAKEFFDEVRRCLEESQLNPIFDSVLEGSELFAPELSLLDRESAAYQRDLARARKSIVYLPQSEAPSPKFFKTAKQVALLQELGKTQEVDAQHLLLADTFRIATDGIYLRDPECLLFLEWARVDLENSSLGKGFEFTAIADSNGRPAATVNQTDYVFSLDPERANGRHLYTVWSRLQTRGVQGLQAHEQRGSPATHANTRTQASDQRAAALDRLVADPWVGGPNSPGLVVRTPRHGTAIGPSGRLSDLRDDPVAEEVRAELEYPIYSAESLTAGPQVIINDFAASKDRQDHAASKFSLDPPLQIPPPQDGFFRFATIHLRADVPVMPGGKSRGGAVGSSSAERSEPAPSGSAPPGRSVLSEQIGETLWRVLYPEPPGPLPPDFAESHLVITPDSCAVWADRGIALAQKQSSTLDPRSSAEHLTVPLSDDFATIASLVRQIDRLTADAQDLDSTPPAETSMTRNAAASSLETIADQCEQLIERAVQVEHLLTLPDREVLRRFADAIRLDRLFGTLRVLNSTTAENMQRRKAAEQSRRAEESANIPARRRSEFEWLEVLVLGFVGIAIANVIARNLEPGNSLRRVLELIAGPVVLAIAALVLKPWKRKSADGQKGIEIPAWALIAAVVACIAGWLAGLLQP